MENDIKADEGNPPKMIKHVRELAEQLFKNVSLLYLLHFRIDNTEISVFWDWSSVWKQKRVLVIVICIVTKDLGTLNLNNFEISYESYLGNFFHAFIKEYLDKPYDEE